MKVPVKREKLSERFQIMIPPSIKQMLTEAEQSIGLDVPEFTRGVLQSALEELRKNKS